VKWTDELDSILAEAVKSQDWQDLGDAFGKAIINAFTGGLESQESEAIPAIGGAFVDFLRGAVGEIYFDGTIREGINRWINETFILPFERLSIIYSQLGKDIVDGLKAGFSLNWDQWLSSFKNFWTIMITAAKNILGISSPSTVFAEIGKNIIQGIMTGMISAFGALLNYVNTIVDLLLAPFAPLIDLITGSTGGASAGSSLGGSTGTVGGRDMGGTLTSTATENYYNYYYGPVYFQGTGQTNGGVDCQSPNPALSALGSSAPRMGVA